MFQSVNTQRCRCSHPVLQKIGRKNLVLPTSGRPPTSALPTSGLYSIGMYSSDQLYISFYTTRNVVLLAANERESEDLQAGLSLVAAGWGSCFTDY
jgi:hypothetical protein